MIELLSDLVVSESFSDIVAITAVIVSLLALLASLRASILAKRIATSEFQAVELGSVDIYNEM